MSFYSVEQSRPRLHRSELAVPGSRAEMFEKAAKSDADVIFLDCEDAVAPDDKVDARKNIVTGLSEVDWNKKTMMVRINGLDTHYMYRDVIEIVEACPRLDMILIPKVGLLKMFMQLICWLRKLRMLREGQIGLGLKFLLKLL